MDGDFEGHDQLTGLGPITYDDVRFFLNLSISALDGQNYSRKEKIMTCPKTID